MHTQELQAPAYIGQSACCQPCNRQRRLTNRAALSDSNCQPIEHDVAGSLHTSGNGDGKEHTAKRVGPARESHHSQASKCGNQSPRRGPYHPPRIRSPELPNERARTDNHCGDGTERDRSEEDGENRDRHFGIRPDRDTLSLSQEGDPCQESNDPPSSGRWTQALNQADPHEECPVRKADRINLDPP